MFIAGFLHSCFAERGLCSCVGVACFVKGLFSWFVLTNLVCGVCW